MGTSLTGLIGLITLCLLSCTEKETPPTLSVELALPFTVSPALDSIEAGTILTLESSFSDSLMDVRSGKWVHLTDDFIVSMFGSFLHVTDRSRILDQQAGNVLSYSFTNEIGGFENPSASFVDLIFEKINDTYVFKAQLKPESPGLNTILIINTKAMVNENFREVFIPSRNGETFDVVYASSAISYNNGINNFYLLQENLDSRIDSDGSNNISYSFYLKD